MVTSQSKKTVSETNGETTGEKKEQQALEKPRLSGEIPTAFL
jgi:hypothetical protein